MSVEGTATVLHQLVDHPPVRFAADDDAGVDQPGDQLLDVERVALGAVDHQVDQRVGQARTRLQDLRDQLAALPARRAARSASRTWWASPSPHRGRVSSSDGRAVATTSTCASLQQRGRRRRASAGCPRRPSAGPRAGSRTGACSAERAEVLGPAPRCPGRAAPAGPRAARRCRRRRRSRARRRPERRCVDPRLGPERGGEALGEAARARRSRGVVDLDAEPGGEHVAQQRVDARSGWTGRRGPRNHHTVSGRSASQASKSKSSRDLPTPASPITVTTRQRDSSVTSQSRSWRKRSCSSRPTVLVSTPSTPPTRSIRKPVAPLGRAPPRRRPARRCP